MDSAFTDRGVCRFNLWTFSDLDVVRWECVWVFVMSALVAHVFSVVSAMF